ncbi:MAG: hypothetical protein ACOC1F_03550 [Myxococcota bacterium]
MHDSSSPPFAALLADRDGHVLGVNPGRGLSLDSGALAVTVVHAFRRLGACFERGDMHWACIDASEGLIVLLPPTSQGLALAVVLPPTTKLAVARDRIERFCKEAWPTARRDGGEATSVLRLSQQQRSRLVEALVELMQRLGCPEETLAIDARRRRLMRQASLCCSGAWNDETRLCLSRLCRVARLPTVERLLGTGSFGSAYALQDGTVLKLTRDDNEARATAALITRRIRRFPAVYHVFRWLAEGRPTGCFGIVRQGVDQAGRLSGAMAQAGRTACDLLVAMRTEGVTAAEQRLAASSLPQWERARTFAREFDDSLRELGITFGDYQPQNLGLLQGELCFFDLSLAVAPAVDLPDIDLEAEGPPGS